MKIIFPLKYKMRALTWILPQASSSSKILSPRCHFHQVSVKGNASLYLTFPFLILKI